MIPVLFVVTILVFSIIRFIPGEPARLILGEKATEEAVAALTEKLGLNEPLLTQYLLFLKQIFTLDFGNSFTYQMPVSELLASRFPVTLALTLMSTVISLVISLPLGYFAGVHKDRLGDQVVRTTSLVAISMPSFWVGLLLMIVFALKLKWLPAGGWSDTLLGQFRCLILPAVTQSLMTSALLLRNTRNSVVDITRMDYVDFARSKGITSSEIRTRHVMRQRHDLHRHPSEHAHGGHAGRLSHHRDGVLRTRHRQAGQRRHLRPGLCGGAVCGAALCGAGAGHQSDHRYPLFLPGSPGQSVERGVRMKRYHGVSPLEQKRSMPAWLAKPSFVIGLLIVLVVILMALFPQFIAPYDPIATDVTVSNQAPSAAHWFGTDFYGRDIFSRVIWGTRIDLLIGVLGVVIPFLVGGMIGLLAGYYGGFLDSLLMRITDIMMAFPFTILVITIMAILGQGLINLFIALWLVGWMSYAKLVRSEVLVLKDSEFIQAARVAGFSDARILFRHLLPNVISSAVVFAASDVVMCMLTGASMSFLGLGVSPPTPEWGSILNEGRNFITFAWWPTLFPGLFLAVSGVGFSLLGDGLTDFLRTKGR